MARLHFQVFFSLPGLKIELDFTSLLGVTQFQVCGETVEQAEHGEVHD